MAMRDQEELLIGLTPSGTGLAPQLPPSCPMPECTAQTFLALLYAIQPNHRGDLLFECLACGYEAVYRVRSRQFKPRPGRPQEGWRPPLVSVVLTAGHPEATPVERMATERAPSPLAQSQLGGGQEDGPTKQASMEKKDVTMGTA